jgi:ABC-type transporter Mla maintaining outer membrane lipid asymmetry ATPase subunit MlaF
MKKLILIVLYLLITPAFSFAETGERLVVKGYNLNVSISKLSSELVIVGQISGGKSTNLLTIYMNLVDTNGKTVSVSYICNNYSNSDKFSIKKPLKNGGDRWKISWADIRN